MPGRRVADDHHVGPHRLDVLGRVDERLALGEARDARGEVLGVGREPLGGQAEAGAGAGRVLEEEVEDDPPLERGDLLAAAGRDLGERLGRVEDARISSRREVLEPEQVLAVPGRRRPARGVGAVASRRSRRVAPWASVRFRERAFRGAGSSAARTARRRCGRSRRPGRPGRSGPGRARAARSSHEQADDVGLDRQLAVAAVDQDRQADPRGPAEVADRVQGRADGPAREQDVVDQHDLRPVDVERDLGAAQDRPAVRPAQVVAVERDVDRADRDLPADQGPQRARPAARASGTPRVRTPTSRSGTARAGRRRLAAPSRRSGRPTRPASQICRSAGLHRMTLRPWADFSISASPYGTVADSRTAFQAGHADDKAGLRRLRSGVTTGRSAPRGPPRGLGFPSRDHFTR